MYVVNVRWEIWAIQSNGQSEEASSDGDDTAEDAKQHQMSSMMPAGVGIGGHCWMSFEDLDLEWSGPNLVCPTDKRRGGSLTIRMSS